MPLRKKPLPRKRAFRRSVKEDRPVSDLVKFKDHVEMYGKLMLGALAFCYAIGILVESLYLGSYGVYHVTIFRFTYVIAGAWAVFMYILPVAAVVGVIYAPSRLYRQPGIEFFDLCVVVFISVFAFAVYLGLLQDVIELNRDFSILLFCCGVSGFLIVLTLYAQKKYFGFNFIFLPAVMIYLVLFGGSFLILFSTRTFPQIPAKFGGGKPLTVQLLLEANKQNAQMIMKNFALCESDKAKLAAPGEVQLIATKPMPLLLATDLDYIVRKDKNTAVTISRDQVKTVLYLDNVDPNFDVCAEQNPTPAQPQPQ
jgi:hypothetical protein